MIEDTIAHFLHPKPPLKIDLTLAYTPALGPSVWRTVILRETPSCSTEYMYDCENPMGTIPTPLRCPTVSASLQPPKRPILKIVSTYLLQ